MISGREAVSVEDRAPIELPIVGRTLSRCSIDGAVTLEFRDGCPTTDVRIEGVFELRYGHHVDRIDPHDQASGGRAALLVRKKVLTALASQDGGLEIVFDDDMGIFVPRGQGYQPWQLSTSNGPSLVSLPSGGLAVWHPLN